MHPIKPLLVYTMTSGLGDYIIMGDLIRKIEQLIPNSFCMIVSKNNKHVKSWPYDNSHNRFFNIYSLKEAISLINKLKKARKNGFTVFGLQMAPGSVQGFMFYYFLKKMGCIDFIVDFNLINADIVTPMNGEYILDIHLNQIKDLLKIKIPKSFYDLKVPIKLNNNSSINFKKSEEEIIIGIHPWTRLNHKCRTWSYEKWINLIKKLTFDNINSKVKIVIFGKDKQFDKFKKYILTKIQINKNIIFFQNNTVESLINTIKAFDIIITVSTSVVPIGYALDKNLIILGAATLDLWIPKKNNIILLEDKKSLFPPSDTLTNNIFFPSVENIELETVIKEIKNIC